MPHQVERCRLFFIICLGEAILTTGNAIIHGLDKPVVVVAGVASMLVIICIWALFFGPAIEKRVVTPMVSVGEDGESAANPSLAIRATNGQQVLVLGMVAFAVGAEVVVGEPVEPVSVAALLALFGGIITCVAALSIFLTHATGRRLWISMVASEAALVGLAVGSAVAGLPGIVVIGLLLGVSAATVWGFSRETRRLGM